MCSVSRYIRKKHFFLAQGGKAYSYKLDVTDRFKVYDLAETIRADVGDVTMLVNNAGIVTGKSFLKCPDELMIKTMEVNTISHFWVSLIYIQVSKVWYIIYLSLSIQPIPKHFDHG